ncbi:MAG: carbohydrate-binding protein [Haloarculaceae archaeon]
MALTGTITAGLGSSALTSGDEGRASTGRPPTGAVSDATRLGFGYGGTRAVESDSLDPRTPAASSRSGAPVRASGTAGSVSGTSVPGRIEAEAFDEGGEGETYHDTDPQNRGKEYRDTGVDIQKTGDEGGGYNIGWVRDGEWLEYTLDADAGEYEVTARVASEKGGSELALKIDGREHGRVTVPDTGAWQTWTTESFGTVDLDAGTHVVRLEAVGGYFNLNWFAFERTEETPTPSPTATPAPSPVGSFPGRIEAEAFDEGGEGETYHDTDPQNRGKEYRDTGVDIQKTGDEGGGYNIGWVRDGEWLEYTLDADAGEYEVTARVASEKGGSELALKIDGREHGRVTVPDTGAWQTWTTESFGTVDLDAGTHVVRLEAVGGYFNLNWFAGERTEETPTPSPTATPVPTDTPTPTATAAPTETPTSTPVPTATPTPDADDEDYAEQGFGQYGYGGIA